MSVLVYVRSATAADWSKLLRTRLAQLAAELQWPQAMTTSASVKQHAIRPH